MSDSKQTEGSLTTLASTLIRRLSLGRKLGTGFDGKRDYYDEFGWSKTFTFEEALRRYNRQDIVKRIVDAPANETWRTPPIIQGSEAFNTAWNTLISDRNLNLWSVLERADKLAGLGPFSVIFLGFSSNGQPKNAVRGESELLFMQPYGYDAVEIKEYEEDSGSPRFGQPTLYNIDPAKGRKEREDILGKSGNVLRNRALDKPIDVHWTRVVHVMEGQLENNIFGTPRIMPVWNLLDDLLKVVGSSSEIYWLSARGGLQADIDKEMELDKADAAGLQAEIEEFQHKLRRFVRTRGVTLNPINHTFQNPKFIFDIILKMISGATGIPIRILTGAEAGQLASSTDRSNWADRIAERQIGFAEPGILIPTIAALQNAGILPEDNLMVEDGDRLRSAIEWPTTYRQTPLEVAQTVSQNARAVANFTRLAMAKVPLVSVQEVRHLLGLPEEFPSGQEPFIVEEEPRDESDPDETSRGNRPEDSDQSRPQESEEGAETNPPPASAT